MSNLFCKIREVTAMAILNQKDKAVQFRQLHSGPQILVLPNAWDAASARIFEQAGFPAVATTSSGVAASLGYPDGQRISRDMLVESVACMTRVVECPITVDIEAGFGSTIEEVLQTVRAIIAAGAVGINIEDSTKGQERALVDVSFQVELLKAIQETASSLDVPLVVNARTDVFLLQVGDPHSRLEQAVQRANEYRQAGADCLFPIGVSDASTIASLVQAINGPVNILAGSFSPSIAELALLGVARVSFGSGAMRAVLARLRRIAHELREQGTYTSLSEEMLSGAEFRGLF
jgi:2-methylisocitrate lyase-like PEP mutase family enzyme